MNYSLRLKEQIRKIFALQWSTLFYYCFYLPEGTQVVQYYNKQTHILLTSTA
jgi:hypothetical protein